MQVFFLHLTEQDLVKLPFNVGEQGHVPKGIVFFFGEDLVHFIEVSAD